MIHLVKTDQAKCFLFLIDLLQRPAWKREQRTWSLCLTQLFFSAPSAKSTSALRQEEVQKSS